MQFFSTLSNANKYLPIANIALLIIIFIAVFLFVSYLVNHQWLEKKLAKISANAKKQEELKEAEYKRRALMEGEFEDKSRLHKIEKKLQDSGLKDKYPELKANNFILICVGIGLLLAFAVYIITNSIVYGIAGAVLAAFVLMIWIEIKINRNYINTENEIVKFINLLNNVSASENTIAEMLNRTIPFLSEPLRSLTEQCYYDIKSTSDVPGSLNKMAERANHKKLKEVITALKVCSTHNENYAEVIEDSRESIRSYIMFKREQRNIMKNALFEMMILAVAGVVIIYMISSMIENSMHIIFGMLPGQIIIIYLVMLVLVCLIKNLKQNK